MTGTSTYLECRDLDDGDRTRSTQPPDAQLAPLRPVLERAITGDVVTLPGQRAFRVTAQARGRCCVVVLWEEHAGERVAVVTVGIARHSRCGSLLWARLHAVDPQVLPLATAGEPVPPEPWCATRVEPGARHPPPETMHTLQQLAWVWVTRRSD
jgi:hypothetical protein